MARRMSAAPSPYRIDPPALVSFSGGRTSAYMLRMILDAHGGTLPNGVHVCFANTGKEREETLRFVHECSSRWSVRVRWLEWLTRRTRDDEGNVLPFDKRYEEVGFNSASRDGAPFAELIRVKGYTPNSVTRFCTDELKVKVMRNFMQAQGHEHWTNVIGLRHDEAHRVAKSRARSASGEERWTNCLPLDDAGVSVRDVRAFWAAQDFDLGLLPFEGNCDGCFLKGRAKLWETERTRPGTLRWWADMETLGKGRFVTEWSYAELTDAVQRSPDLFADGVFDTDPEMDAECGTWCIGEAA
jgi:3'-phosphoadenosine 5'-phosphosulfate sulfotransferase (PAPS reductase)/FAD synthetase